jgi:transcriptional regulator with XRE-family HTH domain
MKNLTVLNKNKRRPAAKNIYEKCIREQREDHNKTQAQIAALPGISQTMYARYARETNKLSIRHLLALRAYYHVSADFILGALQKKQEKPPVLEAFPFRPFGEKYYFYTGGFIYNHS